MVKLNKCLRCGHEWVPRGKALACPKCKSYQWNKQKGI
jgi:predicted Zn-ribbon and HTH transcriptional regulator